MDRSGLIDIAKHAMQKSHAPYLHFQLSASAILRCEVIEDVFGK